MPGAGKFHDRLRPAARLEVLIRGTLLNTATVALGAGIGLALGKLIPQELMGLTINGFGLVTLGLGAKMFLESKNPLIVAMAIGIGAILGGLLGIEAAFAALADSAKHALGGTGRFSEAVVTTSVLFCVGPMTLLGCLQDGLERKLDLLSLKSTLDGIGSIFFAAALGPGVLVTAGVVLVVQGTLTLLAKPLAPMAKHPAPLAEMTGAGGVLLLAIGLSMLGVQVPRAENYLLALVLAPLLVVAWEKLPSRKAVT